VLKSNLTTARIFHSVRTAARVFAVGRSEGHGPGQEVLQTGKREWASPASSRWATTRSDFSDGHNTGIYTWDYLYKLGRAGQPVGRL
jgi:DUF971 family protein